MAESRRKAWGGTKAIPGPPLFIVERIISALEGVEKERERVLISAYTTIVPGGRLPSTLWWGKFGISVCLCVSSISRRGGLLPRQLEVEGKDCGGVRD